MISGSVKSFLNLNGCSNAVHWKLNALSFMTQKKKKLSREIKDVLQVLNVSRKKSAQ